MITLSKALIWPPDGQNIIILKELNPEAGGVEIWYLKIDNGGHTMMSSNAIYFPDDFGRYVYRWVPLFFMLNIHPTIFCTVKTNWEALEP